MRLTRRVVLANTLAGTGTLIGGWPARARDAVSDAAAWEGRLGGRLGVAILDKAAATPIFASRADERFPLCSTHKVLSAAFVLARVDAGQEDLARSIGFAAADLVPYSPLTQPHAGGPGLTLDALCAAAVTVSDNTAANLLLNSFGGPTALTAWLRTTGDSVTRLDRSEPTLNEASPGDPRDTTTPRAMVGTLGRLLAGDTLSATSRARLAAWMEACTTGLHRLRAGAPAGWRVGDKTGSGRRNATNDVAVLFPPGRKPILVAAYAIDVSAPEAERAAVFTEIGRRAARP